MNRSDSAPVVRPRNARASVYGTAPRNSRPAVTLRLTIWLPVTVGPRLWPPPSSLDPLLPIRGLASRARPWLFCRNCADADEPAPSTGTAATAAARIHLDLHDCFFVMRPTF